MTPIKIHTTQSSVYNRLSQDVIVSRLQPNGRFVDTYVADLLPGDKFFVPEVDLPPRSIESIFNWIGDNRIEWQFESGLPHLGEPHVIEILSHGIRTLHRHTYDHSDHGGALREALEYVLDMEEL